ncbi:periplasmic ligand-binding sensor domain protein [Legionella steigerwaltii]|uniref:Periplasmic ligand-binding sensor domain protein n=1 Tax=Legionella steigerwaltii TaxID=460 RepID=A0A378L9T3_9GAMM|nr:hypothetical protein [Legionella steigerwaltii]KTD79005.1 periplasmic ligand-binding sensor domain protein [Legionella steigerwaltii]STY23596.1 periplasmic ligand-binding sensor domain protein [Legionella steigerwaltii]
MYNKTDSQTSKVGQPTVTAPVVWKPWDLSYLKSTPMVSPLELAKYKMMHSKEGTSTPTIWQMPVFSSMMKGFYNPAVWQSPVFSDMMKSMWSTIQTGSNSWMFPPMELMKQKLQTQKSVHAPKEGTFTPSIWQGPVFSTMMTSMWSAIQPGSNSWMFPPMELMKQKLQTSKSVQVPTVPTMPVTPPPGKGPSLPDWVPSVDKMYQQFWNGANFTAVALTTSFGIVAVQSPMKTILVNLTKNGTMLPVYQGGVMGFMKAMYAGTSASISGSVLRTGYVTTAKGGSKPLEEGLVREEDGRKYAPTGLGYLMAMTLGEQLITQGPEAISTLKKIPNFLPPNFTWKTFNNAKELIAAGFVPRYAAGMGNFFALCILEERIAKGLPIEDSKKRHFVSGATSGALAAFTTYPLAVLKDYIVVQFTINQEGQLKRANSIKLTKELFFNFINNPGASAKAFGEMALKQVPLRMSLTAMIFGLVAGIGETMGPEPLSRVVPEEYQPSVGKSRHGIFATKSTTPRIEEIPEDTDEHTQTQTSGSSPKSN